MKKRNLIPEGNSLVRKYVQQDYNSNNHIVRGISRWIHCFLYRFLIMFEFEYYFFFVFLFSAYKFK